MGFEKIKMVLPAWIAPYAQAGINVDRNTIPFSEDHFEYYLHTHCPPDFEAYGLVLHPFKLNPNRIGHYLKGIPTVLETASNVLIFQSWEVFFTQMGYEFHLKSALETKDKIQKKLLHKGNGAWPEWIEFPAPGICPHNVLPLYIRTFFQGNDIEKMYLYFDVLKNPDQESDILYRSLGNDVSNKTFPAGNPTAIFSESMSWCLISDVDLPFSLFACSNQMFIQLEAAKIGDMHRLYR